MLIRRICAALAVFAWLSVGGAYGAATVDRAVCSTADKAGGDPSLCSGQELIDSATQEINAVRDIAPQVLTSVSGADTITACTSPAITAYVDGGVFQIKPAADNTTSATLNICTLTGKPLVSASGAALAAGDLRSSTVYLIRYLQSADQFRVLTSLGIGTASASQPFVTVGSVSALPSSRRITAGTSLTGTDGGALSTYTIGVTANGITDTQLRTGGATSVIGRSANSTGNVADISASANGQYLARRSGALTWAAPTAAESVNTPAGNIAATDVQTALNELDTEKAGLAQANTFTSGPQTVQGSVGQFSFYAKSTKNPGVAADWIASYGFQAPNASGALPSNGWGEVAADIVTATAGSESGKIRFNTIQSGSWAHRFSISNGLYAGSLTDQGAGTGNFTNVFVNGSNLSTVYQPLDSDLTAIAALTGNGIPAQTAAGTWSLRTMSAPAAGLSITNPGGVAGNPTFALANDLAAVEGLSTNGIPARTATDTWTTRTITGTANEVSATNGDGVSGNPTLSLPSSLTFTGKTVTGGTFSAPTINGGTHTAITGLGIRSTGAAFDLKIANSETLTADRTVTVVTGDAARTLTMTGNASIAGTSSGTNTGDQTITLTGDVTGSGTGSFATTIAGQAVTYAKMQNISATARVLGRKTAGAGATEELAAADINTIINSTVAPVFANISSKPTTLSGYGITDAQGIDSDLTTIAGLTATTDNFIQAKSSAWASRTPTQVTADLIGMVGDSGSGGTKGLVPAPAAGDTAAGKFLKADGTWASPPGAGGGSTVTVNSGAQATANLNDSTPAATGGGYNVKWQSSGNNVSAYLDINGATTDSSPDMAADYVPTYDASAAATKKVLLSKIGAGNKTIWVPARAMTPNTTNGCNPGSVETSTNKVMVQSCDFDTSTQEFAQFHVAMPKSWDLGTITAQFYWSHASTTTNFGVVWAMACQAVSDNDALDTAFGTAQQIADTGGTTNNLYITSATPSITVGSTPATGDDVICQVKRVPADGSDTMAIDARLMGVKVIINTSANTDN